MNRRTMLLVPFVVLASNALGQVYLKPRGGSYMPLRTKGYDADVAIAHGVATTKLTLTFANTSDDRIEADFVYTLPPDALVTGFAYWYGEEKVVARITSKERAAAIYQHITSRMRDPALIEMVGRRTFRARIFPIMPNADLRVEIQMLQVLPGTAQEAAFTLPLKFKKGEAVDEFRARVAVEKDGRWQSLANNYGLPETGDEKTAAVKLEGKGLRPTKDLVVRLKYPNKLGRYELVAARSGGRDGFFLLVGFGNASLLSSRRLYATSERKKGTHVWTGRYRPFSPTSSQLEGVTLGKTLETLDLPDTVEANNPASKFWASDQIERLTRNGRAKQVSFLSHRFGMPSKYTSWIAIPKEERERYRKEMLRADLESAARERAIWVARGNTQKADAAKQRVESLLKQGGEEWAAQNQYAELIYDKASDYANAVSKKGAGSREALRIRDQIRRLGTLVDDETRKYAMRSGFEEEMSSIQGELAELYANGDRSSSRIAALHGRWQKIEREIEQPWPLAREYALNTAAAEVAQRYLTAFIKGRPEADTLRQRLIWLSKEQNRPPKDFVHTYEWSATDLWVENLARARRAGRAAPELDPLRQRLRQLETVTQANYDERVRDKVKELAARDLNATFDKLWARIHDKRGGPTTEALRERVQRLVKETGSADTIAWNFNREVNELAPELFRDDAKISPERAKQIRERLDRVAAPYGITGLDVMRGMRRWELTNLATQIQYQEEQANLDEARMKNTRERLESLAQLLEYDAQALLREAESHREVDSRLKYLRALRQGGKIDEAREEFRRDEVRNHKKPDWVQWRIDRIETEVRLDNLEEQPQTPELVALRRSLEVRRDELRAKMGDPLIYVTLPTETVSAVAKLPWGELRPMHRRGARWEARFDVPSEAKSGEQRIVVEAVQSDGRRLSVPFGFRVDNEAPAVRVQIEGRKLVVSCDEPLARVNLIAEGKSHSFVPLADGRWELILDESYANGQIVAVDRAHNRSAVSVDFGTGKVDSMVTLKSPVKVESISWQSAGFDGNVQSLGVAQDALVAGTLEEGLWRQMGEKWELVGNPADAPREVVTFGHSAAVRLGDGRIQSLDSAWPLASIPGRPHASAIGSDGTRLLAAQYGGWSTWESDAWRSVFDVAELRGQVPSAIAGDDRYLWLGTQGSGVARIDRTTHEVVWFGEAEGLSDDWVTRIAVVGGRVYAGTFAGGLAVLNGDVWNTVPGTEGDCVTALLPRGDELLVASRTGLYRVAAESTVQLSRLECQAVAVKGDKLYVGTRKGIYVTDWPLSR